MNRRKIALGLWLCVVALGSVPVDTADLTLIAPSTSWKYNDSGANLGSSWRATTYNDASWPTGNAQLGYGDGDEATVLSWGSNASNRRITYYFRRSFTVANPAAISALVVRFVRDDGCVIYINGVEVVRSNMPSGSIGYTTRASTAISGTAEGAWNEAPVDPARLVAGTNVIAVEIHQQSPTSTDISFDLELRATDSQPVGPTVTLTAPAHQTVSNVPAVTFGAAVAAPAGLSSATLFVGAAAQTAIFSGPSHIEDAQLTADTPTLADGDALAINVDGQGPHAHGVMKFPTLVGSLAGQVPAGAIVSSATLQLDCTNAGQSMRLYRLTESWAEDQVTWNERALGVAWGAPGADGTASHSGVSVPGDCTVTGQRLIDLTPIVQDWINGVPNHGIVLIESGTDGVDFSSSESIVSPILTVTYKTAQTPVDTRTLTGTSANVTFGALLAVGQSYTWNVRVTDVNGQHGWAPADFEIAVDAAAPSEPVLVTPPHGATGVELSPALAASVSNPDGGELDVTFALRQAAAPEFTIIALPDTQHYSESFPAIFTAQTQWIVANKAARNIVFVTHEGDIVNANQLVQWERANASMSLLDGVVPYGMGPGNHDLPTTFFNQFFPWTRYQNEPWYGGHMGTTNDNNFQLFSASGLDFVIVHLTFCPPAAAVTWADSVFKSYPDRIGIVTTHAYLNESAQRSTHGCTSTQYLWDGLAVTNPNLRFMLSGHVHNESRRIDFAHGKPVFQMLADYQDRASGGEGWLRILRFVPAEDKVFVQTYSPWLNRYEADANSEFTLDFPMGGAFSAVGQVRVPSGSTASVTSPVLEANTEYEWRVTATNGSGKSRSSAVGRFTTGNGGAANLPPTALGQSLATNEDNPIPITLAGSDPEGGSLSYTVITAPAHGTLSGTAPALTYQPASNYNGADAFSFSVSDGQLTSALATVSIAVQPVNDLPVALPESYSVSAGSTLMVNAPGVLSNDTDSDSAGLAAQLVTAPTRGVLTLNANGSFSYAPNAGYSGPDSFTYRASDGGGTSGVATVALTIAPPVDTTPPVVALSAPAAGTVSGGVTVSATATDAGGVVGVQFLLNGSPLGAEDLTSPYGIVWSSTAVANGGPYQLSARARDAAGNVSTSATVAVTVANTVPSNLIAAYSFNEGTGTTVTDRSGRGHTGTISGATWSTQGRHGGALSFDGVNDTVTINDTAALDLTTGMTLEAWVLPSTVTSWRTVMLKERSGGLAYALYTSGDGTRPSAYVAPNDINIIGTAALSTTAWSHVAVTYEGTTLRLFVNGSQVASRALSTPITTSTGALRIGGNSVWGEYFQGRIDEVRIYNRALTAAEIQADMAAPITP